ncbi:conserved oligomeric Golgi complex subunit 4-like protein [Sarcoptes scabiei]|uniref:Conserved oligomeric Golgi complex subunit 4 n=1 Tax=Sarcoptes scabiei TaxID=52283 RepID=A0A132A2B2_SARSC|nr:conserved oligomeric Golgi complex subunit 4-like protein [Sarcoptes scabiei]
MDDYHHIHNRADIISALEHLNQEESKISEEIDSLLSNQDELKQMMSSLMKRLQNVSMIEKDTERLENLMSFTSNMANNVSDKIRSFDLVQNRVSDCLKQIEDIIDLRCCTDGIQQALSNENFEEAARLIYRFLSMDETVLRRAASEAMNGNTEMPDSFSLEQSFAKLHEAEQSLRTIVRIRFDEAIQKKDFASVERFFKIYPLIKQSKKGLEKFAEYLWGRIWDDFESKKITPATKASITLMKLSNLFEIIAQKIDDNYSLIETYYGPGHLFDIVRYIQTKCDFETKKIIESFQNEKTFCSLVSNVSKGLKMSSTNQTLNPKIDPKLVDKYLNDVMFIINRIETYLNFITQKMSTDLLASVDNRYQSSLSVNEIDQNQIDSMIRDCNLTQLVHDLNSIYVLLEEYFLKESIQKAIQMDVIDVGEISKELLNDHSSITSSMLDDIFFIIKKCLKRSISCGSINVLLAMINHSVMVLETTFYDIINERIKCGYPNTTISGLDLTNAYNAALQAGRYLQSSTESSEKMRISFISSLNNLDTGSQYVKKLCNQITDDVNRSGIVQNNQRALFDSCLSNFNSLCRKFDLLIHQAIQQLYSVQFKPLIKSMIDSFQAANHQLNDSDVNSFEVGDGLRSFIQTFLIQINSTLIPFRKQLTEKNFSTLIQSISFETSNQLYESIFKCSFNKFGGFQFDREIRSIINFFSNISNEIIREHFVKLKFVALLFTMDSVEEINEYLRSENNHPMMLRLNPNELIQLLRSYTELNAIDIKKIKI